MKDAIKAAPKAPLPYLYLSQLYSQNLHKPELGLKYAQQALALDPANLAAYIAVYEIYRATNQPKKAAADSGASRDRRPAAIPSTGCSSAIST